MTIITYPVGMAVIQMYALMLNYMCLALTESGFRKDIVYAFILKKNNIDVAMVESLYWYGISVYA